MGTVLDKASGMLFPLLVESTIMHLALPQPTGFEFFLISIVGSIPFMVPDKLQNLQI